MTIVHEPGEFRADNGATFRFVKREDGGIQVSILNSQSDLLAGFPLTPYQVVELFHELDFCPECGEPLGDDRGLHGPGLCFERD